MYDDNLNIYLKIQGVLNHLDLIINDIKLDKLFNDSFVGKYTRFSNIYELLKSGGFIGDSEDILKPLSNDYLDKYILSTTNFNTWDEFMEIAINEYFENNVY